MGNEAIVETIEKLGNELREFKGAYDKKLEELSKPKEVVVPPEAIKAAVFPSHIGSRSTRQFLLGQTKVPRLENQQNSRRIYRKRIERDDRAERFHN